MSPENDRVTGKDLLGSAFRDEPQPETCRLIASDKRDIHQQAIKCASTAQRLVFPRALRNLEEI